ncbi:MAG: hypothetical protein U0936_06585 [Planctomycetaceae bacterium]
MQAPTIPPESAATSSHESVSQLQNNVGSLVIGQVSVGRMKRGAHRDDAKFIQRARKSSLLATQHWLRAKSIQQKPDSPDLNPNVPGGE